MRLLIAISFYIAFFRLSSRKANRRRAALLGQYRFVAGQKTPMRKIIGDALGG